MTTSPEEASAAPVTTPEFEPTILPLVLAILLLSAAALVTWRALQPPEPRESEEGVTAFSAAKARTLHAALLGDEPRPVGSAQHERVRSALITHLESLGYRPEIQRTLVTTPRGATIVNNIVAGLAAGDAEGDAILVVAHYDSVGAGPGAADDGAGVVTLLEIARILKSQSGLARSVILLLTDGEEGGLRGASAFVQEHPWAARVSLVINLEARGSRGPVRMFETGADNLGLMRRFAEAVHQPAATSVAGFIYERMPNDTDFSVFRRAGQHGYNLAFIGGVENYHTPGDTLEALDTGTLQHLGDQALALVQSSARATDEGESGQAVYFDVAGRWLLVWSVDKNLWLLGGAAALLLIAIAVFILRGGASLGGIVGGLIAFLLITLAGFLVGHGLEWAFRFGASPSRPDTVVLPSSPWAPWLVGAATGTLLTLAIGRRISAWSLWLGLWLAWLVAAGGLTFWAPAAAYPFLVPSIVAAVIGVFGFGWLAPRSKVLLTLSASIPVGVAAMLWMPLLDGVAEGLGGDMMWCHVLLATVLTSTLIPAIGAAGLAGRVFIGGGALIGAATAVAITFLSADFNEQAPRQVGLGYVLDESGRRARWLVILTQGALHEDIRRTGPFKGDGARPFPWSPASQRAWETYAEALDLPEPELEILESEVVEKRLRIRARLRSPRGATVAELYFPPDSPVQSVRVLDADGLSGEAVTPFPLPGQPWQGFRIEALPADGIELELQFAVEVPTPLYLLDRTIGLPEGGELLIERRDRTSSPGRWGDGTWVSRRVPLER